MVEFSSIRRSRRTGLRLVGLLVVKELVQAPATRAFDLQRGRAGAGEQIAAGAASDFIHCKSFAK